MNSKLPGPSTLRGRHLVLALFAASLAVSAFGQEPPPTIVSTGEATVYSSVGQVEFRFVRHFIADTLEASITECQTFLEAAPQAIRGADLQPLELKASPPLITSLSEHQTRAVVTVRFGMAAFNAANTGPLQFAALCDKLAGLADTMKATLSSPVYAAAQEDPVEAAVVSAAMEKAYLPAEAAAQAVKSAIYAVDSIEVVELVWEQQPDPQPGDVHQIACRGRVQVTYVLTPQ